MIKKRVIIMKVLITSALPYVNNVPHLGNIIGCVLSADVFARYCRLKGYETLYVCGTDEYGTATEIKALEEKTTPRNICDKYYKIHREIYEWFGIRFDIFGRTTTEKHTEITQDIFLKLYRNGYIAEEEAEQLYDEKAGMFLADRYVEGTCPLCGYESARGDQCEKCGKLLKAEELVNPVSKITKTKPVKKKSKHLFIDLPKLHKKLEKWIEKAEREGHWSSNTVNIARGWLKEGLKKRAITRDLKWGVKVPLEEYKGKVFYVWFDATIGYISITANLTEEWEKWWKNPKGVRLYQFMGKDNVPFHTIVFPGTLMGTGENWTLPYHISSTEFLNYEDGKFSKSRGVGVFGSDARDSGIPPDVWRYYLLSNRPESNDSNFSWVDFRNRTNSELLANLGNLVNRTLVFISNNFEGRMPEASLKKQDKDFLAEQKSVTAGITDALEKVKIREALNLIMHFSKNANRYFQDNKPWVLVKTDRKRAGTVLNVLANQVKDIGILAEPYLPLTSERIFKQLNLDLSERKWKKIGEPLAAGHRLGKPKILFRKLEEKQVAELRKKFAGKTEKETGFARLDLEVGEIKSVESHPDADKLYVEKVLLSDGERQVVSGLAPYIPKEKLLGKKVVVVKNLLPAKLRGVESNGMLLVAETPGDIVEILECPGCKAGEKVVAEGIKPKPKKHISIKEFSKIRLEIEDGIAMAEGKPLLAAGKKIKTKLVKKGKIS